MESYYNHTGRLGPLLHDTDPWEMLSLIGECVTSWTVKDVVESVDCVWMSMVMAVFPLSFTNWLCSADKWFRFMFCFSNSLILPYASSVE